MNQTDLFYQFLSKGWILEKFKGFWGIAYYALEIKYIDCWDWKYVSSHLNGVEQSIIIR